MFKRAATRTTSGSVSSAAVQQRLFASSSSARAASSLWAHLDVAPLDSNHATNAAFEADQSPLKVNLGRGVYKDDNGKNWVLPSVRMAEEKIFAEKAGHDYLPFKGWDVFCKRTSEFAFGETNPLLKDKRVATVQAISGTGALRVGAEFLSRFLPPTHKGVSVYVADPTYVNHLPIFKLNGFEIKRYRYYDPNTNGLDLKGFVEDLQNAPEGSVILLHACAHNPTGVDPSFEQWKLVSDACKERRHVVFFDCAYQGFASGDIDRDGAAFRYFAQEGHQVLVAQSYAKNMGLYGQRVGALNIVTSDAKETEAVMSQLNQVIRPMYSNPPAYGARIVGTILSDPTLRAQWQKDVKTMADRIIGSRQALVDNLEGLGSKKSWKHITNQIGMFAYSGLTPPQVQTLRTLHVYMNLDGRMSVSGVNSHNVEYLAQAMHKATSQ
ncbi:glutamicoxaloacetic transaminase, mitochondrial, putative [Acanthamoeba castellanii str. Neff]|uniref:Aspartate aminotransferase n=1 Tax=Acanthamoeba castellanii (strain ATCC 30010 / Neff) TaxID=1257118 RepID=L8HKA6_ACACF|nr:glutamicoxaloacetic transaminase, mitochondrial, putative [Acanthamoeba castellanii str. Neff]ELR25647.1 glutamicoxaloacetic transaminase, mitochondrial, putative [Acanthamoeba castellanii str. Neff]